MTEQKIAATDKRPISCGQLTRKEWHYVLNVTDMNWAIWCCTHRASSYNMYIKQQDAQNSCVYTLFSIRCSTSILVHHQEQLYKLYIAFGICRYHTSGCCVAIALLVYIYIVLLLCGYSLVGLYTYCLVVVWLYSLVGLYTYCLVVVWL